jgi:predicted SnoaL-like aldol condensation-catalyzing enzyme
MLSILKGRHDAAMPGLFCILMLSGCAHTAPGNATGQAGANCVASPEANRAVVLAFYKEGLTELQPRKAFEQYVSPQFVEHKADVEAGTREATIGFLERLIKNVPEPRWDVVRTIAEGDMVFLHGRFVPAKGAPPYAIADVFRLKDCLIVEHWDVVAPPPQQQRNPHSRF